MHTQLAPGAPPDCPKYLRLAKSFERQLQAGVLRVGDRLPSVRRLRDQHSVSVATAMGCYLWLERQGYIRSRPKSGFYVSRTPTKDGPAPAIASRMRGPVPIPSLAVPAQPGPATSRPRSVDLGAAVVSPALLPMNRLNRSVRTALAAFGDHAVRYEEPLGSMRLRRQIARLVFRQGAACAPEDVIVTSGATEALNLSVRAVARPGDVVAFESPGCYDMLQALEALHMRAIEIPHVPHEGIDLDLLASAMRRHRVKALLMTATCHNPLGDCVSDDRKAAIVSFAAERDLAILEGDIFGDLVFLGERPRSLKAFDESGVVLQCSSLAHYVAPGFNVGWSHAGRWRGEVERLKAITNVASARLPQLAMAEFLESGAFDKHLKQLRTALWRSVEFARQAVLETFPAGTRVSRPEGGFVLWIQLPERYDGRELQRRAAAAGVVILPGQIFSPSQQYRHCIRINCGHPLEVLGGAIKVLANQLAS